MGWADDYKQKKKQESKSFSKHFMNPDFRLFSFLPAYKLLSFLAFVDIIPTSIKHLYEGLIYT